MDQLKAISRNAVVCRNGSPGDVSLFTLVADGVLTALVVYVDDILVTSSCLESILKVKAYLHDLFTIKDLGDAKFFLGLELTRTSLGFLFVPTQVCRGHC